MLFSMGHMKLCHFDSAIAVVPNLGLPCKTANPRMLAVRVRRSNRSGELMYAVKTVGLIVHPSPDGGNTVRRTGGLLHFAGFPGQAVHPRGEELPGTAEDQGSADSGHLGRQGPGQDLPGWHRTPHAQVSSLT